MKHVDRPVAELGKSLTLVVGDMRSWLAHGRDVPAIEGYYFIDGHDLTPQLLREMAPTLVLSSLVSPDFDAIEIARKLGRMEYAGAYRVLTRNMPDLSLIAKEVQSVAPDLNVDIIDLATIFPDL